jgi:hypothetical protein
MSPTVPAASDSFGKGSQLKRLYVDLWLVILKVPSVKQRLSITTDMSLPTPEKNALNGKGT